MLLTLEWLLGPSRGCTSRGVGVSQECKDTTVKKDEATIEASMDTKGGGDVHTSGKSRNSGKEDTSSGTGTHGQEEGEKGDHGDGLEIHASGSLTS